MGRSESRWRSPEPSASTVGIGWESFGLWWVVDEHREPSYRANEGLRLLDPTRSGETRPREDAIEFCEQQGRDDDLEVASR